MHSQVISIARPSLVKLAMEDHKAREKKEDMKEGHIDQHTSNMVSTPSQRDSKRSPISTQKSAMRSLFGGKDGPRDFPSRVLDTTFALDCSRHFDSLVLLLFLENDFRVSRV